MRAGERVRAMKSTTAAKRAGDASAEEEEVKRARIAEEKKKYTEHPSKLFEYPEDPFGEDMGDELVRMYGCRLLCEIMPPRLVRGVLVDVCVDVFKWEMTVSLHEIEEDGVFECTLAMGGLATWVPVAPK